MPPAFHLVTDFDGVWTDPEREMRAVYERLPVDLCRLSGEPRASVDDLLDRYAAQIAAEPTLHGWRADGHLSSYVDEDAFALPTAMGQLLAVDPDPLAVRLRAGIETEFPDTARFLDHCYHSTCSDYRISVDHDLAAGADPALAWLLEQGVYVTFVTNAPGEKVVDWFGHHGFTVADGREVGYEQAPLRVVGRSGKQTIGDPALQFEYNGRTVSYDRPLFRELLEREPADLMIGDVLSLDLAQPLAMRMAGNPHAPRWTALMQRHGTPAWLRHGIGGGPHRIDALLTHIAELPPLIQRLMRVRAGQVAG